MIKKNIFNQNFLLVSHYATYAMQDLLYGYLTENSARYIKKINFPLPELPFLKRIEIEENKNGKTMNKLSWISLVYPAPIAYLLHFLQFLWLGLTDNHLYEVVVAEDSLLALASLMLKKIGKVKNVVFYSHGLAGNRFDITIVNDLYIWMDKYVALQSDLNWLLSKKMVAVRLEQGVKSENIFWVPTALQLSKIKRSLTVKANSLVFLGTFNEMNGVLLLPDIMRDIKKTNPNITLDIIGDGPLKKELEAKIEKFHLSKAINLLGLQQFEDYKDSLTNHAIGIAPYKPSTNNLLQSTDPMKLRLYMAAGIPILTTKGFAFSKEVVENKLGFAVEYSSKAYGKQLQIVLKNRYLLDEIRKKALVYSKQFDQDNVFKKPLLKVLYEEK